MKELSLGVEVESITHMSIIAQRQESIPSDFQHVDSPMYCIVSLSSWYLAKIFSHQDLTNSLISFSLSWGDNDNREAVSRALSMSAICWLTSITRSLPGSRSSHCLTCELRIDSKSFRCGDSSSSMPSMIIATFGRYSRKRVRSELAAVVEVSVTSPLVACLSQSVNVTYVSK